MVDPECTCESQVELQEYHFLSGYEISNATFNVSQLRVDDFIEAATLYNRNVITHSNEYETRIE